MKKELALRRFVPVVLSFSILAAFSSVSCKKEGNKKKQVFVQETDPFFNVSEYPLELEPERGKEIESYQLEEPKIIGKTVSVNYSLSYKLPDGSDSDDYNTVMAYRDDGKAVFDFQGNLIRMTSRTKNSESDAEEKTKAAASGTILQYAEGPEGEAYALVFREEESGVFLCKLNDAGDPDQGVLLKDGDFFGLQEAAILVTAEGKLVIANFQTITIYDKEGNLQSRIEDEGLQSKVLFQDGKYYAVLTNATATKISDMYTYIQQIDLEKGALTGEKIKNADANLLSRGSDGSYLLNTNGVVKVNLLSPSEKEPVMEWDQTDFNKSGLSGRDFKILSKDEMVFFKEEVSSYSDGGDNSLHLNMVVVKRAEKNPYAGKPILRIAENTSDFYVISIRNSVIAYNTAPDSKCRIMIHDYAADMDSALSRLQKQSSVADVVYQEMVSGNGPDILVNFSEYPKFNTSGYLLDLNTLIDDKNVGIDRGQYFDNILRANEVNGKLYHIPVFYGLYGLAGSTELLGESKPWTYSEFFSKMDSLPSGTEIFEEHLQTAESLFPFFFSCMSRELVDYENKEVNLESDSFKALLDLAKRYGTTKTEDELMQMHMASGDDWVDSWTKLREGMLAFVSGQCPYLNHYLQLMDMRQGKMALYPVPSDAGLGLFAQSQLSVAISNSSAQQSEAWDFIRFVMDADRQLSFGQASGFPINREALDTMLNDRISKYEKAVADSKNATIEVYLPMKVDAALASQLKGDIESINGICSADPDILMIILEEAPYYMLGQKSLDEVCHIIQNRASTVVKEK
ncbi:MAG: extracellular solute-binding protein [Clostridiales bacterium]|nr:extracellular solute-binding protein [Clostridiales bacterium]